MNINKIADAIELDAGESIDGLRESLQEMQAGNIARETTPEQILLQQARQALKLSQTKFATLISTPVATIRDWEQGRFKPSGSAIVLCKLAIKHPDLLSDLDEPRI
ncbi:helix-turn-helix domain-containing protein [Marinicellulosiphila megalodicopiae]|uniref:helix-turn-helix domain-containing protein n=1 Tax=Marinicellulosiphila megalodicopiae TaxID=2724896 RepID=UPI003BB006DD